MDSIAQTDPVAAERLGRLARRLDRSALVDFALAAVVVLCGFGVVVVSLFFVKASTPLALLLRVHALGLLGLLASCWGAALGEKALLTRQSVRQVRDWLLPQGQYHQAYAVLLSRR